MIQSFRNRGLKRFYARGERGAVRPDLVERIETILLRLDVSEQIEDMDMHAFRLHPLKGDLKGFWSVTVNANWRIIFRIEEGDVFDVDLVDYH